MESMENAQRQNLTDYWKTCHQALIEILNYLGVQGPDCGQSLEDLPLIFDQQRSKHGGGTEIANKLHITKEVFEELLTAIRRVAHTVSKQEQTTEYLNRATLNALRLLNLLGRIKESNPALHYATSPYSHDDDLACTVTQQKLRALELMIRSLINEAYISQDHLRQHFEAINKNLVTQWARAAEKNNLLSGAMFGELISLFIGKTEYPRHYQKFYEDTPFLNLFKEKRKTLEAFFEDIRHIRNQVAHHKKLSQVQVTLLEHYYQEIVDPLQQAYDNGNTSVNPDQYKDASDKELQSYFARVEAMMASSNAKFDVISDDISLLRTQFASMQTDVGEVKRGIFSLNKKMTWSLAGIVVVLAGVATVYATSTQTLSNTNDIKKGVDLVGQKMEKVKLEVSADPRKELANRGVLWNRTHFNQALRAGDLENLNLFLQGGMKWYVNDDLSHALAKNNDTALATLLTNHLEKIEEGSKCNQVLRDAVKYTDKQTIPHRLKEMNQAHKIFIEKACKDPENTKYINERLALIKRFDSERKQNHQEYFSKYGDAQKCKNKLLVNGGKPLKNAIESRGYGYQSEDFDISFLVQARTQFFSRGPFTLNTIVSEVNDFCDDRAKLAKEPVDNYEWEIEGWNKILKMIS